MTKLEKYDGASRAYLDRLTFKNLQPTTLENYRRRLCLFRGYLAAQDKTKNGIPATDETEITFADVEGWAQYLQNGGLKPSTVSQYLTELKTFFERASKPSFPAPYDLILPDAKAALLYRNDCPDGHLKANWPRNYAMIQLCLNEKIRNAELLDLRLADVDFRHHELTIRCGKGRKSRTLDMTPLTESALRLYLNSGIRPAALSEQDYLFGTTAAHVYGRAEPTAAFHRGTGQWLSGVIERTVYAITGFHGVRSHDLRHLGARLCLGAGESIEQIQGELGHANLSTTQIYSGRLEQRRSRESAKAVFAERGRCAAENERRLAAEAAASPAAV